jgi:hypothetical protein
MLTEISLSHPTSGFLVIPFTIETVQDPHVNLLQEGVFTYDFDGPKALRFDNNLKIAGPLNSTNAFVHVGDRMYAYGPLRSCFCTNVGIGILNYDAFADARYLGR